jgi:hypothetical protein
LFLFFICFGTSALEHLRKKIEISTEKIRLAKVKEQQAKKVGDFKFECDINNSIIYDTIYLLLVHKVFVLYRIFFLAAHALNIETIPCMTLEDRSIPCVHQISLFLV